MASIPKYKARREVIYEYLASEGLMVADLADELGVTANAAYRWLEPDRCLGPRTRQRLLRSETLTGLGFRDLFVRVR